MIRWSCRWVWTVVGRPRPRLHHYHRMHGFRHHWHAHPVWTCTVIGLGAGVPGGAGWAAWRLWPPYGAGCCGSQAGFPGATGAPYAAPEPSSLWLLVAGLAILVVVAYIRRKRTQELG